MTLAALCQHFTTSLMSTLICARFLLTSPSLFLILRSVRIVPFFCVITSSYSFFIARDHLGLRAYSGLSLYFHIIIGLFHFYLLLLLLLQRQDISPTHLQTLLCFYNVVNVYILPVSPSLPPSSPSLSLSTSLSPPLSLPSLPLFPSLSPSSPFLHLSLSSPFLNLSLLSLSPSFSLLSHVT